MNKKFLHIASIGLILVSPLAVYAATYNGPTAKPPEQNTPGPVWLSPTAFQSGDVKLNGDFYIANGKSIRVDVDGSSVLNLANYQAGTGDAFTLNVAGDIVVSNSEASLGKIQAPQICIGTDCRAAWPTGGGSGDITSVLAGSGLSGGSYAGDVTLSADYTTLQSRVSGSCASGSSIRAISQAGAVTCEADDNSGITSESDPQVASLSNGGWCTSNGSTVSCTSAAPTIDTSTVQKRITGICDTGKYVKSVNADGTVNCTEDRGYQYGTVCSAVAAGGSSSLDGNSGLFLSVSGSCASGWNLRPQTGTGGVLYLKDINGNTVFTFYGAMNANADKMQSTYAIKALAFHTSSDARLKNVKRDFDSGLSVINALDPKVYTWKRDENEMGSKASLNIGFLAQDVKKLLPEAVGLTTGDQELPGGTLTLNEMPIIAASVNAIKELDQENKQLKEKVSSLEDRISALEALLK